MAEISTARPPRLTPEQRRAAVAQFERANQVLTAGDFDYGRQLLLNCARIDPLNPVYRQALRQAQRARFANNQRGQSLAYLRSLSSRWRLTRALQRGDDVEALYQAELILMRNPWDLGAHLGMARAFEQLDCLDLSIWTLEQLRPSRPDDVRVNRRLAGLYERRGNFMQAIALWQLVRRARPHDEEAQRKAKDLAASATIAKGRYEEAIHGSAPTPLLTGSSGEMKALSGETKAASPAETHTDHPPAATETSETAAPVMTERSPREAATLQARIEADPQNPNTHLHLAGFYRRHDQLERAHDVLQKALEPTRNHFDVQMALLDLEIEPLRHDLAITEERLRQKPGQSDLVQVRSRLAKEINSRELEYHRRRSDRYPTDAPARFEMALRLVRAGHTEEAIRELQTVRNDPRCHGKALFYLGFCFKLRKNWRLAQRNFEEALPLLTDDPALHKEALYLLATGSADVGEHSRAIDYACELANVDYGYKNINRLLDEWQAKAAK